MGFPLTLFFVFSQSFIMNIKKCFHIDYFLRKILLSICLLLSFHIGRGQVTIVNYDFNSGSTYATLSPVLATNISSVATSTEAFITYGGVASGAAAFTVNSVAGTALGMANSSGTNTRYFQFAISGSALNTYSAYKIYCQGQRSNTGAATVTLAYSTDGTNFTNFSTTGSPGNGSFSQMLFDLSAITGINNQSNLYFRVLASGASGTGTLRIDNFQIQATQSVTPSSTISTSGTLSAVNTTFGTASSNTSFSVSGTSLTNNIIITAPTGFEISTNSSSGFGSSVTLTQSSGSVSATTIYVHLAAVTPVGTYSDSIRIASAGATSLALYIPPSTVFPNTGGTATLYGVGTLSAMSTTYGAISTPNQSFTVSGSNLGSNTITVTAPSGFEISTNAATGFSATLTLTPGVDGFVTSTTIYIHLSASANAGNYSGDVSISSSGATTVNISVPSSTISPASQSISFVLLSNKTNVDNIRIAVRATSGLPVTLISYNPAYVTITPNATSDTFQINFLAACSYITLVASQSGNGNYTAASNVNRNIYLFNAISKWNCDSLTLSATTASIPSLVTGSTVADMGLQNGNTLFNGYHSNASTNWTTPSGNGSNSAISSNNWSVGDWYVFKTSTSDFHSIVVMFDQTSSSQGPKDFKLQYSLDSVTFTDCGNYTVPSSATTPINWIKKSANDSSQVTIDLRSILALNDASAVWFRMVCRTTNSIGGATTLNSGGTSRIDNFRVAGTPNGFYSRASNMWESNTSWNIIAGATPIAAPLGVYPIDTLCNVVIYGPHSITTSGIDYSKNITLEGNLTLPTYTYSELNVAGNWYKSATGSLTQNNNLISFIGGFNATLTAVGGQLFSNLKLNKSGVSNTLSLIDSISISKSLTISSGTLDLSNKNVALLSNATTGTAAFGSMGALGTINYSGTGRFVVERYIATGSGAGQHGRSWQFLSVPTNGDNQTIKAGWQEGATASSQNPVAGYGIQLSGAGGVASGFDTVTIFPSIKTYSSSNNSWVGTATTNDILYNPKGYMVFVRGDRTVTNYNQTATPTILRSKGKLFANGNLPPTTNIPVGSFESIGNPYASPVDFTLLTKANVDDVFYVWDPLLTNSPASQYGLGGYQAISAAAGYLPTPGGTLNYPSNTACTTIQSGQAFMVRSSSLSGSVSFSENAKSTTSRLVNRTLPDPATIMMLTANLFAKDNNVLEIVDGNRVILDNNYNNAVDENDVVKLYNGAENFAVSRSQTNLAIETRKSIANNDTIYYHISGLREANYQIQFIPQQFSNIQQRGYLIDSWLNNATPISLTDTTVFNFNITSDAGSQQSDRFKLVFQIPSVVLPVTFTCITATRKGDNSIEVNWSVENEINMSQYELERSDNGNDFSKISSSYPTLNNGAATTYSYTDQHAISFDNFYRVKAISQNGKVQYSPIVKVAGKRENPNVRLYANPVNNGSIQLAFTNQLQTQNYFVQIFNTEGRLLYKNNIKINSGNQIKTITLPNVLSTGIYQIKLTSDTGVVVLLNAIAY